MDDIENPVRQACILGHLSQQHTGSRILLTWFHDKCVANHSSQREHLEGEREEGASRGVGWVGAVTSPREVSWLGN